MKVSLSKTIIYLFTVVFGQLVSFLLLPIITRYLSPQIYGEYALALTIFNLLGVLGSSWIRNVAFRLYFEEKDKGATKSFYLGVTTFQFLLVLVLILGTIPIIQISPYKFSSAIILFAAGVSVLTDDFYNFTVNLLRAENLPKSFAFSQFFHGLFRLTITVTGLWLGYRSPTFLFVCSIISGSAAGIFAIYVLKKTLSSTRKIGKDLLPNITKLGIAAIPLSVGGWVTALSDRMILKYFTSLEMVGIYSVGYSLGQRIIEGLAGATFMMAWPTILESWQTGGETEATRAIHDALKMFIWLTVGPLFFLLFYAEPLTGLLTGAGYEGAAKILPVVAAGCWLSGLKKYYSRPLELRKNYALMSKITIVVAVINIILNFIFIPKYGAIGAAWATFFAFSVSFILFYLATDRSMIVFPIVHLGAAIFISLCAGGISKYSTSLFLLNIVFFGAFYLLTAAMFVFGEKKFTLLIFRS